MWWFWCECGDTSVATCLNNAVTKFITIESISEEKWEVAIPKNWINNSKVKKTLHCQIYVKMYCVKHALKCSE